jgi:tRNA(adenine34) deaminase
VRSGPDAPETHNHKRAGRGSTLMSDGGSPSQRFDVDYMRRALELAAEAQANAEVPVGAVLVHGAAVVAVGYNCPISSHDPTAHAEVVAMRAAGQVLGNYRLNDTTLYVTLEPCIMCAAAIVQARVRRLVFGAWDQRAGAAGSIINVFALPSLNHRVDVFGGVLSEECAAQLEKFFDARRVAGAI